MDFFGGRSDRAIDVFRGTFSFPNSILFTISSSYGFLFLLAPVITSYFVRIDYQLDTWKMILPRTSNRGALLCGKLVALFGYLGLLIVLVGIIVGILGIIGSFWLNTSFFQFESLQFTLEKQEIIIEIFVFLIWYVSIATFLTISTRSIIAGTFGTFAVLAFCNFIRAYSPEYISIYFAPSHFGNLIPGLDAIVGVHTARPGCSSIISWIVVSAHILAGFLLSYLILMRQNFASK